MRCTQFKKGIVMVLTTKHVVRLAIDTYQQVRIVCQNEVCYEGTVYKFPPNFNKSRVLNWFVEQDVLVLQVQYI